MEVVASNMMPIASVPVLPCKLLRCSQEAEVEDPEDKEDSLK